MVSIHRMSAALMDVFPLLMPVIMCGVWDLSSGTPGATAIRIIGPDVMAVVLLLELAADREV